jgi:hypothetical protein
MREKGLAQFSKSAAAMAAAVHLGLVEAARRVYVAVLSRNMVRRQVHQGRRHARFDKAVAPSCAEGSHLAGVTIEVIELAQKGAKRADLLRFPLHLQTVIALVVPEPRDTDQLDLLEQQLDGLEDELAMRRRVRGSNPHARIHEAEIRDALAAANWELAVALRSGPQSARSLALA